MKFQGMLEDTNAREKAVHPSYKDLEELDFQILLTDNYYINPNSNLSLFSNENKKSH